MSNGVQIPRNFTMIFYGPEGRQWALVAPGGAPRGSKPTRARQEAQPRPGGLCPPRVPPGPPLCSINTPKIPEPQERQRNIHPAAAESRTTRSNLDTITEGFTTSIGASPMMREQFFVDLRGPQLVSRWLSLSLSLAGFSIQWSLGDRCDVTLLRCVRWDLMNFEFMISYIFLYP